MRRLIAADREKDINQKKLTPKRLILRVGLTDHPICLPLVITATAALLTVLLSTRSGAGLSPDSAVYIGPARSLLAGEGLSTVSAGGDYVTMTHYPPLFPSLLTGAGLVGVEPALAARWLNALLFGATTLLVGGIVHRTTDSHWISIGAAFFTYSSSVTLSVHAMAWSEPLFIFHGPLGLTLVGTYVRTSRPWVLILASAAIGLAFLTRYVGPRSSLRAPVGW